MTYRIMDLFSGAGGLSNGFVQTKQYEVDVAVEKDADARRTYEENHDEVLLFKDILNMDYSSKEKLEDIDIIIGGPPCQGFSNANRQKNSLVSGNNQLVKEFLRAVEFLKPRAFVMENVRTMESKSHKFLLTEDDQADVDKLNLNIKEESISIGYSNFFVNSIIEKMDFKNDDLTKYIIEKPLYSKLNTLMKKLEKGESEALLYITRNNNKKVLIKYLTNWSNHGQTAFSKSYEEEWNKLGNMIDEIINSGVLEDGISSTLSNILEIQKIINKLNEVKKHRIIHEGITFGEESIVLNTYSYNVFAFILKKIRSLGYHINEDEYIFNAANYGVPQKRKRLIIIGVHDDYLKTDKVQVPQKIFGDENCFFTIHNAISDLEQIEPVTYVSEQSQPKLKKGSNHCLTNYLNGEIPDIHNHIVTNSTAIAKERFAELTQGQNFHNLSDKLKSNYSDYKRTQNTVYKRLSYYEPSGTVVNIRKSMWVHPVKDRALSIREAARLQSFTDDYIFYGSKDSQYQQIGNAVPPLLGRAIAESLLLSLGEQVDNPISNILKAESLTNEIQNA
ncbi:DNA cytosine methyltransferase [Halobacillus litoralis]|uniref:DNA cytosine methyltransferase n=1 Tax=Halobacillus litoralis TaxID=45668 RepID=UPI001CD49AD6|nr:DNA cytosine methyltransferase [Halobacillus litoralis]MCA0970657.1 DNA cytosine methyltransferase [Halobacillus litoralis]